MRKVLFACLPAICLGLVFTGCGDESTGSPAPTLNSQDRQNLASLPSQLPAQVGSVNGYVNMASSLAKSFAGGFTPKAARTSVATCDLNSFQQTIQVSGMSTNMSITKADGTAFGSCDEAANAYTSGNGIGIRMTMAMDSVVQGMNMDLDMVYNMIYKPVGSTGGYELSINMEMDYSVVGQGYSSGYSIDPLTMTLTASSEAADPTMTGSMNLTTSGLTMSRIQLDESGIVTPQVVDVLKDGSKVATVEFDANGNAVAKDLNGQPIQG